MVNQPFCFYSDAAIKMHVRAGTSIVIRLQADVKITMSLLKGMFRSELWPEHGI